MIRSMTAFGRAGLPLKEGAWQAEIRSVNSRYFELSLKISPALALLENRIREQVQGSMRRGKVSLSITQERQKSQAVPELSIDEAKISFYLNQAAKIKKKFKLQGELTLSEILRFPGVFGTEEKELDGEKLWPQIKKVLTSALEAAQKSKAIEGAKLAKDMESRLNGIGKAVTAIEKHSCGNAERFRLRLKDKITALITDKSMDSDRLEREVAFLVERADITEELVRFKSHLDLFKKKLHQDKEVGKELDFLCQEINREINTMGSKSQHFEIATEVVFVKGELEKIREQIQNIE